MLAPESSTIPRWPKQGPHNYVSEVTLVRSFIPRPRPAPQKRNLQKVPFVELFDGKLQGVVSSGSDIARVYVSFFKAGTGEFSCSTNNNRACNGLRGGPCKHLDELVENAVAQYGAERVGRFMGVPTGVRASWEITSTLGGHAIKESGGQVFARFLDYLRYVELPSSDEPRPEMAWFVTG